MKTHKVLDLTYHENEEMGQGVFAGTSQECEDFIEKQGSFGYCITAMTPEEMKNENYTCPKCCHLNDKDNGFVSNSHIETMQCSECHNVWTIS